MIGQVTNDLVIQLLYVLVPVTVGCLLAIVDLASSYHSIRKKLFTYRSVRFYVYLSAFGSLLLTLIMRTIGTKVIDDDLLNCVLLGIFGAGVFVEIIPRFSLKQESLDENTTKILTIRDYVYAYLRKSIERIDLQEWQDTAKTILDKWNHGQLDKDRFLREFEAKLEAIEDEGYPKKKKKADFQKVYDHVIQYDHYDDAILILLRFYDGSFIENHFAWCLR